MEARCPLSLLWRSGGWSSCERSEEAPMRSTNSIYYSEAMNHGPACRGGRADEREAASAGGPVRALRARRVYTPRRSPDASEPERSMKTWENWSFLQTDHAARVSESRQATLSNLTKHSRRSGEEQHSRVQTDIQHQILRKQP